MPDALKIKSSRPIAYIGGALDRRAEERGDKRAIAEYLAHPKAAFLIVRRHQHPVIWRDGAPEARFLNKEEAGPLISDGHLLFFLGLLSGRPWFAIDISNLPESDPPAAVAGTSMEDLRTMGGLLPPDQANLMALAGSLSHWHRRNGFCSACGSPTEPRRMGFERTCVNPDCAQTHYPRNDPVVIMLVVDDRDPDRPKCLLGRSARHPKGVLSTLAGYVEPGESLEQAVVREVFEEAGIRATDCGYRHSQPWPFPCSLMIGFRARAATFDIALRDGELLEAAWHTRDALKAFGEWGDDTKPLKLPRPDSIARALIEDWLTED